MSSRELLSVLSTALSSVTVKGGSSWVPRLCEADSPARAVIVLEPLDPSEPSVNAGHVDFTARRALLRSHGALVQTLSQRFPGAAPEVEARSYSAFLSAAGRVLAERSIALRVSAELRSTLPPRRARRAPRWLFALCALVAAALLAAALVK